MVARPVGKAPGRRYYRSSTASIGLRHNGGLIVASAYPAGSVKVLDFKYKDDLYLTRDIAAVQRRGSKRDANYIVAQRYCAEAKVKPSGGQAFWFPIEVPCGLKTDLSSVPSWARWYMSRVGPHLEASIVHDWLYVAWHVEGKSAAPWMRSFADDVFRAAMKKAGVRWHRRTIAHGVVRGVEWIGFGSFYNTKGKADAIAPCVWCISKCPADG